MRYWVLIVSCLLISSCSTVVDQEYNTWNNNIIFQKLEGFWVIDKHEVDPALRINGILTNDYTQSDPFFYNHHYIRFTADYTCTIYFNNGQEILIDAQSFSMDNKEIIINNERLRNNYQWDKLTNEQCILKAISNIDGEVYNYTLQLVKIDKKPF